MHIFIKGKWATKKSGNEPLVAHGDSLPIPDIEQLQMV